MPFAAQLFDSLWRFASRGARPDDDNQQNVRKAVMTMTALIIGFLAVFWGSTYAILGYPIAGSIPLSYSIITLVSIVVYFRYKHFESFRFSQLLLILLLPFLLQWSLGGFSNGSIVMIWAFFTPLAVLLADGPRSGMRWLTGFLLLAVISGLLDPHLAARVRPMPEGARTVFFLLNMAVGLLSVYAVLNYFVKDSRRYQHQLQSNEQRITELMLTDPLTGVANRRGLDQWLDQQAAVDSCPLSLIMADLDRFKHVNDTYGHKAGDQVLKEFVQRTRTCVRGQDLLARFGGEEFVIVLPRTPCDEAYAIAERVRMHVQQLPFAGIEAQVTASFGLSCTSNGGIEDLLARADRALYRSKASGRNRVSVESA